MRWSKIRDRIAFPLFIGAVLTVAVLFRHEISELLGSAESFEHRIETLGAWTFLALVAVQILQVVVFVIPGEVVQIGAGYLFGVLIGSALSTVGILIGSSFNYWIGKTLGTRFVRSVVSEETLQRVRRVTSAGGVQVGFFLLFVIPGIPKDVLCYVAGAGSATERATGLRFIPFLVLSTIGRLPGIVGSALIGASAASGRTVIALTLLVGAAIVLILGIRFRPRLERLITRSISRRRRHRDRSGS